MMDEVPRSYVENYVRMINVLAGDMRAKLSAELAEVDLSDVARAREQTIAIMQRYCGPYTDYASVIAAQFFDGLSERVTGAATSAIAESGRVPEATAGAVHAIMKDVVDGKPREVWEDKLLGRADKEVRNAADVCIARNANRAYVRWARVPQGMVTCEFCIMLASRGAVYKTEETASSGHENCDCRVLPDFGKGIEGYDPDYYLDCYEHPEDHPEIREAINERRRERYVEKYAGDDLLAASYNFMNRGDELYERMNKIEPIEGFSDYALHSDGYTFDRLSDKSSQPVDVATLADWIRADPNYDGGNVRLLACFAGRYDNGAAKQLAELLGVTVRAPEEFLYVNHLGEYTVAATDKEAAAIFRGEMEPKYGWRDFEPSRGSGD